RKYPYSAMMPFRFPDRSLTGVRLPDLRRAVPPQAKMKHSACLFIRQACQSAGRCRTCKQSTD
ncbi:hypothetical protein ACUOF8_24665, partial [Escherichia coli]